MSFPAGLAKMDKLKFTVYTSFGAFIWIVVLTLLGYYLGENQLLIHKYLKEITIATLGIIVVIIFIYINRKKETL